MDVRDVLCCAGISFLAVVGDLGAKACTTVAVGARASATGFVMVGHTEDFDRSRMDHAFVPARDWPAGALLPPDRSCARIPQVPRTYGFYWSSAVTRRGVCPCCDSALNEKGVFVTMNYGGKSRIGSADPGGASDGDVRNRAVEGAGAAGDGVRDQVLRCVAERAADAHGGMQVVTNLLSRYGMTGGGWIWVIADRREAWIVQGVNGRHFVANRVADDEVAVVPNVLTVREPSADTVCSPGLADEAVRRGWSRPGEPFDFSRAYQGEDWFMHPHSVSRFRQAAEILTGRPWTHDVTFSVRPRRRVSARTVKTILSSHVVEGPDAHADEAGPICRTETGEASVCVFGGSPLDTVLDVAFGRPCLYPWIRLRPLAEPLPDSLAVSDAARRFDEQFERKPAAPLPTDHAWRRLVTAVERISAFAQDRQAVWRRVKQAVEDGEATTIDEALAAAEGFVAAAGKCE